MTKQFQNWFGNDTESDMDETQRERAVYRVAARTVLAYWFRLPLDDKGVVVRGVDSCDLAPDLFLATEQAEVCVHLAGRLAEAVLYPPLVGRSTDDELHTILDWADWDHEWPGDGADEFGALRRLVRGRGADSRQILITAYRCYEAETLDLLRYPPVWKSIECLAAALLEQGGLSYDQATALLSQIVCAGALH
jgi:hypothetical protein